MSASLGKNETHSECGELSSEIGARAKAQEYDQRSECDAGDVRHLPEEMFDGWIAPRQIPRLAREGLQKTGNLSAAPEVHQKTNDNDLLNAIEGKDK